MKSRRQKKHWVVVVFVVLLLVQSYYGVGEFEDTSQLKRATSVEESIRKAAVQCYAIEGSYPPSVEYLADHYGLLINESAYFYHYDIIGSNIMPNIAVYKRW